MTKEKDFSQLGLSTSLLEMLTNVGYEKPTPIQSQIIPHIIEGKDVLGCAQTGTGKTASFTLPMIDLLSKGRARARMPRSLVLIPTRELAMQVQKNFDTYSQKTSLKQALLIGGSGFNEQVSQLDKGVDVLIATPGRLLDLYDRGKILLHDIKILVLDEADRMLDMGFMPDIEKLNQILPKKVQTLMFSATMPKEIRKLAQTILNNPIEVTVAATTKTAETITQYVYPIEKATDKKDALKRILDEPETKQVIVFCNTKKEATSLSTALKQNKHTVGVLHGDLTQGKRTQTMDEFAKGDIKVLIASNVAARGLDVETISHVINYDIPSNRDDYIHRIGRTGRAGQSGVSVTFVGPNDREAWQKVVGKSEEKVLDYVSRETYQTQKPQPKPGKQKVQKKEDHPEKKEIGFGASVPPFMELPLDLPASKAKKLLTFYGLHDKSLDQENGKKSQT